MRGTVILLALALILGACQQGRDFARPQPESFVLGTTTQTDIENKFGKPYRESTAIRTDDQAESGVVPATPFGAALVPGSFANIVYVHSDRTATIVYGGVPSAKTINFVFWNGTLVGYNYVSTFEKDSSDFDENQIKSLRKGQTTKAETEKLLGRPTGRLVYPLIRDRGDEAFLYDYVQLGRTERKSKSLVILFGSDGTVRDVRFGTDAAPTPPPSGGGFTPMPIFIPRK